MKKTTVKTEMFRQGDVLIERIAEIPSTATRRKGERGRIILAHGEATGHHHSLDVKDADWWKTADGQEQFVTVNRATEVVHQEHSAIPLAPGNYRVKRQREYSPEEIRNVAD